MKTDQEVIRELIERLDLTPLPGEGGWFRQTYRSGESIPGAALPARYASERSLATAILYLITRESFSALHRLLSDETFHFYLGQPVEMLKLLPDGSSGLIRLGQDFTSGQVVQTTVPRGVWQGARLMEGGSWALLGATVAPGFEYEDLELGRREELAARYPDRAELIARLTRA